MRALRPLPQWRAEPIRTSSAAALPPHGRCFPMALSDRSPGARTLMPERSGWVSVFHTYSSGESVWETSTCGCWGTSRSLQRHRNGMTDRAGLAAGRSAHRVCTEHGPGAVAF